jgi:hypothetical protein
MSMLMGSHPRQDNKEKDMKAYFALLLALLAFIIAPILNTAVNAMQDAGDALTTTPTTIGVELIPAIRIER